MEAEQKMFLVLICIVKKIKLFLINSVVLLMFLMILLKWNREI